MDEAAFLTIEFQEGTRFRWMIPRKFAWKLFIERWINRREEKKEIEVKEEKVETHEENTPKKGFLIFLSI